MRRIALLALALGVGVPHMAAAQSSLYGVVGLGFPGRPIGVRARGMGGSLGAVDPGSAVNPAPVAQLTRLAATVTSLTSLRDYRIDTVAVDGLQDTRFPFASLAGGITGTPLSFEASYANYLSRTWDITSSDTVVLRGQPVGVEDRIRSDGAVADLRGALGWYVSSKLQIGGAFHLITGSTRERIQRQYSDRAYTPLLHDSDIGYTGFGWSVGLASSPVSGLRLGVSFRSDGALKAARDSVLIGRVDLPMTVSGGFAASPLAGILLASTVTWQSWSDAQEGLTSIGGDATTFDTWDVSAGLEIGGGVGPPVPIRLGFRYAQLPFSPGDDQVREIDLTAGTGFNFAQGRAAFTFAVERVSRDGGGASERAWQLAFGLSLLP
ncbi:MAG: hypothetical protein JSW43_09560 [Gemmatimonadota bacterium]|nr:MAG: hypothetical protein JSW43_09560 [Gemmatimonadota bacterium]